MSACQHLGEATWVTASGITALGVWGLEPDTGIQCGSDVPPPADLGTPTQVGQLIVTPTRSGSVIALHVDTGQTAWSFFATGTVNAPVIGTPAGDVAFTTAEGRLVVLNGTTGAFKWSAQLDTTLSLPPAANQTTIFVATPSGVLDALPVGGCNAATCSPVWHATLASPASVRPSIGGNVVYVGSNDGTVTAFAANGCNASTCSSLWSGSTGSKITGAPAIGHGAVVVGSDDGTVTAFALQPQT
jgi:outer membrane protein assembly factor BamB